MGCKRVLVTGAGGFIGHHLVRHLVMVGHWVRGVDIKRPEFEASPAHEFRLLDLRDAAACLEATRDVDQVYALAADMGGMGFISEHHAEILHNNVLIDFHTIEAARRSGVDKILYTSSACVYPGYLQDQPDVRPLKEEDVFPAEPQDAYGWAKLTSEQLYRYYDDTYPLSARIVRFHNIFGPLGTWRGGREKAPAAICRKVAEAKLTGNQQVEVWGDGEQTRSFCYIDDCIEGLYRLMQSDHTDPINLGQDRLITINELVDMAATAAGIHVVKKHVLGPQGVRGRNSDNNRLREALDWEPLVPLEEGISRTYQWIEEEVRRVYQREDVPSAAI